MFETAELGRSITRKQFDKAEGELRTELLKAQRAAFEAGIPVIIIISGVEGAGKGSVVSMLTRWLDTRLMQVHVFWDETDEERERPTLWRFWRTLPPRGTIGVLFGSWYTRPIVDFAFEKCDEAAYTASMHRIADFEQMLTLDGALIVKFWFHLSKEAQRERYQEDAHTRGTSHWNTSPLTEEYGENYDRFEFVSEQAIRMTDTGLAPWYVIEAQNAYYRDLTTGRTLLAAIRARLDSPAPVAPASIQPPLLDEPMARKTVLDGVEQGKRKKNDYKAELEHYQRQLHALAWRARKEGRSTVVVFEGWDAAGKGGAIRRVVAALDPRLYRVITVAAPTDEERAQHYLWRFWRQIPRAGRVTIYDRSWYGRVLVERVEGFARPDQWMRAYHEINAFESELIEHGTLVVKFWLHITPDEQLARFEERQKIPWKQHKITEEDWRNRDRWEDYAFAVNDMVQHTSTTNAPWTLVGANDKKTARITVLKTLCETLARGLGIEVESRAEI